MARRYRTTGTGVTADPAEARANRRLQLISSMGHPVEGGKTLLEKMEEKLDRTLHHHQEIQGVADEITLAKSEGRIQGMLAQLAIMRSTSSKVELTRAKVRIKHGTST